MRGIGAPLWVGAGDEEGIGPANERSLACIKRHALVMGWRGRSREPPGWKATLDVLGAVAKRLRHGQQDPLAGTPCHAVQTDPLPGAELDRQHADLRWRPVKGAFKRVPEAWHAGQQDLGLVEGAGETHAAGDQRCPDAAVLVLAGDHDERLPAEECAELGRDEGQNGAADLGRYSLDTRSPLNGALTLVKQRPHAARWRARRGGGGAL